MLRGSMLVLGLVPFGPGNLDESIPLSREPWITSSAGSDSSGLAKMVWLSGRLWSLL